MTFVIFLLSFLGAKEDSSLCTAIQLAPGTAPALPTLSPISPFTSDEAFLDQPFSLGWSFRLHLMGFLLKELGHSLSSQNSLIC